MARPRKNPIKTVAAVERALLVLEAFQKARGALSLTDVVSATGLLKTTVFRLLHTFENAGYLVRLPDGRFQLGAIFMQFGMAYRAAFRLEDHIVPVMERLVHATEESASFYVREGDQRLCLLRVDSRQPVRDVAPAGALQPIDDTAASQILREYSELDSFSRSEDEYRQMVKATIGKGRTTQVASVSVPIFGVEGLVGALSLTGPRERFNEAAIASMTEHLVAEGRLLIDRLSGVSKVGVSDDRDDD